MTDNFYVPEGQLFTSEKNRELISSVEGLRYAMDNNITLEALAVRCLPNMELEVDLNGIKGVIPREECVYCKNSGAKDIAIITRVGKPVCFRVVDIFRFKGKYQALLSRSLAQKDFLSYFTNEHIPGDIVPCRITHLEHFGAFVDIGNGVISLLPIDAISVSRISHPSDRFEVGEYIYSIIKSIDADSGRIYMSHKELLGTWVQNAMMFQSGQTVCGIVRSIEDYGIFVELAPNLAGLAELRDGVEVGELASVYIKSVFPDRMKIKLAIVDSVHIKEHSRVFEYYIDPQSTHHIDKWTYSPPECNRVIETVF